MGVQLVASLAPKGLLLSWRTARLSKRLAPGSSQVRKRSLVVVVEYYFYTIVVNTVSNRRSRFEYNSVSS